MSKDDWIEMQMAADLIESEGFDLLVMGRPEGPGCYCAANNTLRRHLEILSGNYPVVVIDNEAGMEHLSRRTTAKIDLLLLVSEPSPVGIMTAARIRDLAKEMEVTVARTGLVINRVSGPAIAARLVEEARGHGLEVLGTVPMDDAVVEQAMAHLPAFRLARRRAGGQGDRIDTVNSQRVTGNNTGIADRSKGSSMRGAERGRWAFSAVGALKEGEDGGEDH